MPDHSSPFILVDGSSYLYRAFHALPPLINAQGFPTGAVYGVINMLKKIITDFQPKYMAVVFDPKGKTFRNDLYEQYKANRQEMPQDLIQQIQPLHDIIRAMGLPLIIIEHYEADDIIGTLAAHATTKGLYTIISTGDKDLAQIVNDHVSLINTMTNKRLNIQGVIDKFGVHPSQMIDYLTLIGDTSDNIPGVPKVGPKTAVKWLSEYHSLDKLTQHAHELTGKVGENFRAFIQNIPLTKSLVTIDTKVSIPFTIEDLMIQAQNEEKLIELFKTLGFKSWLKEISSKTQAKIKSEKPAYKIITRHEDFLSWVKKLESSQQFSFDTETSSLDYMQASLVGMSFATTPGDAIYIPLAHESALSIQQLNLNAVLAELKPIFENDGIKKIGQNIKYDMGILANYDIHLHGVAYDTMLESYVLNSISNQHDMDSLALKHLNWQTITYEEVAGKGNKQIPFAQVDIKLASQYAAEDADVTLRLHEVLWPKIQKDIGLKQVFEKIEMPLVPVLSQMERYGVLIDPDKLQKQGKELNKRLNELMNEAYQVAGKEFNINSPKQLQEILFEHLKLPILQKTPKGQASTADAILQELALDFEMPKIIIEYRSLSKLISTYTNRLVEQINPKTGRIHTSYNQASTATGRLSSSDPNLQNIPIRSIHGRRIRQAFIAPKDYQLLSADYSQIELRLMAHISQDPGLLTAFNNHCDIHKATAAEIFGISIESVTPEMRRHAKAINFGLIYGMSAFGLTRQIDIDRKSAQEYIDRYFARYPKVKEYMDKTKSLAEKNGYVETLWGRRLYLPEINSKQIMRKKAAERTAINAPLQGSAADMIKLAMIHIHDWLYKNKLKAKMIMQVHDELVFEVHQDDLDSLKKAVEQYMCQVTNLSVPILVGIGVGNNWDEASNH